MKYPKLTPINFFNGIGIIIALSILVSLGQTIKRNYELNKQIDTLNAQIIQLQDQKDELAFGIEYYKTDSFREREARSKLGLQAPGENVISLPQATPIPSVSPSASDTIKKRSNFYQWIDFFTGTSR